jgi:hypothetical protein
MDAPSEPQPKTGITLRWLIAIVVGLVLLMVFFYFEEDWRGARAWTNFKRAQAAEGETMDFANIIPPPVAEEQNFAMTPLLRPALDYVQTANGLRWRDPIAYQHLSNIRIDLGDSRSGVRIPKITNPEQGIPLNLKAFADFYRGNTNYPQSAHSENDASVILTALNKFEPDLKELREAAATRPYSRFPVDYSHEPASAILLPHLASVKGIALVCDLRAVAELESRRPAEALADLEIGLRLSASLREEPFLIDHLVRIDSLDLVLQAIREGLNRHAWNDAQLAEIETNLANINLLSEYAHVMRGERALNLSGIDYVRRRGFDASDLSGQVAGFDHIANFIPSGWYYQNMLVIGENYRDYILPAIDASNRVVTPLMGDQMLRNLSAGQPGPYNILAKMLLPAVAKSAERTARGQTFLDETRVACAIERYRMQHNELPPGLNALTPQFLPAIPTDLFDGKPLRYKKNSDGSFLIYSIGWNATDDGGAGVQTNGNTPHTNPEEGDWVWSFPPK